MHPVPAAPFFIPLRARRLPRSPAPRHGPPFLPPPPAIPAAAATARAAQVPAQTGALVRLATPSALREPR